MNSELLEAMNKNRNASGRWEVLFNGQRVAYSKSEGDAVFESLGIGKKNVKKLDNGSSVSFTGLEDDGLKFNLPVLGDAASLAFFLDLFDSSEFFTLTVVDSVYDKSFYSNNCQVSDISNFTLGGNGQNTIEISGDKLQAC